MIYNLGFWGLAKYYLIPLLVYQIWASSFLSLFGLVEQHNIVTLTFYKYPKWVEFLLGELNYAFPCFHPKETMPKNQTSKRLRKDEWLKIPHYNLEEAFRLVQNPRFTCGRSIEVRFKEMPMFSGLKYWKAIFVGELRDLEWGTALYLAITPILALYGLLTCTYYWQTWALLIFHYSLSMLGITAGYHRLWSHKSYQAHPILKLFLLIVGTGSFQMSVFHWCRDHRAHHRYTDTDKDPYNIKRGFWYAHIGWLLKKRPLPVSDISDLEQDPFLQFQHEHYHLLSVLEGLVLPTVVAGLFWGDWIGGFFLSGVASRVLVSHATFCVNSVAHYFGDFTYSDKKTPRDSWLVGIITFGEGYHNFHHEFPFDFRNGYHWTAFDPTKWMIWIWSFVGLTSNLQRFPEKIITMGRLQMQEKDLATLKASLDCGLAENSLPDWTWEKVAKDKEKMLLVYEDFVHDVRSFISIHPGGSKIIESYIGKDITEVFNGMVYSHSNAARNALKTMRIAKVAKSS